MYKKIYKIGGRVMQATQQKANQNNLLEKVFKLSEHGTNVKTEIIAGITTFMTMAYILAVNSNMLAEAGMDAGAVFVATALSATISCFVMAFLSNYPIALAPGMGLNAFFAYTVVLQMGYTWQMALLGVFIEGVLFIILTVTSLREQIINFIPKDLKNAVTAGVGLFIASVGMTNAGIINTANGTLALSSLHDPLVVLSVVGLGIAGILVCRNVRGALLLSILLTSAIGMLTGIVTLPTKIVSLNVPSLAPTFMQAFSVPLEKIFSLDMVIVVFTFLFMDLFDSVGFLVGVAAKGNLIDENGKIPKVKQVYSMENRELIYTSLSRGYVDAIAAHEISIRQYMSDFEAKYRILDEDILETGIGVAFAKNDQRGIEKELSKTLKAMVKDGSAKKILQKYVPDAEKYLEVNSLER